MFSQAKPHLEFALLTGQKAPAISQDLLDSLLP
jgi:hypothetical protein